VLSTAHTFEWGNSIARPEILAPSNIEKIAGAIVGDSLLRRTVSVP
jgi:hypothetical protein